LVATVSTEQVYYFAFNWRLGYFAFMTAAATSDRILSSSILDEPN
jgi:hypothetical protein